MATSGNKHVQLCTPKAIAAYTGLYAYLNGFVEAWSTYHNQKPIMMTLWLFTLLKVCTKIIKNSKHDLLKINRSHLITAILSKS